MAPKIRRPRQRKENMPPKATTIICPEKYCLTSITNQSIGAYAGDSVASPTLQRQWERFLRASLHAGSFLLMSMYLLARSIALLKPRTLWASPWLLPLRFTQGCLSQRKPDKQRQLLGLGSVPRAYIAGVGTNYAGNTRQIIKKGLQSQRENNATAPGKNDAAAGG